MRLLKNLFFIFIFIIFQIYSFQDLIFTKDQILKIKNGQSINEIKNQIKKINSLLNLNILKERLNNLIKIKNILFWQNEIILISKDEIDLFYPYFPHSFSLNELIDSSKEGVSIALIDTGISTSRKIDFNFDFYDVHEDLKIKSFGSVPIISKISINNYDNIFHNNHSTFVAGIISGKFTGIAKNSKVSVIKTFDENGQTDLENFSQTIKEIRNSKFEIINLSLKIADKLNLHDEKIKELKNNLKRIEFLVISSGNKDEKNSDCVCYPARFNCSNFTVGSFCASKFENEKLIECEISDFSMNEKGQLPNFLMPGSDLISCFFNLSDKKSYYSFASGTSFSCAFFSGILSLILSEFKDEFNQDEIFIILSTCAVKLHNNQKWNIASKYGVVDLKTTLVILHILKYIKQNYKKNIHKNFKNNIERIYEYLQKDLKKICNINNIKYEFKIDFLPFYLKMQKLKKTSIKIDLKSFIKNVAKSIISEIF